MKSIRIRVFATFFGTILGVFLILAALAVYYLGMSIEVNSAEAMQRLSKEKTVELNTYFTGVERAVGSLEDYLLTTVDSRSYHVSSAYRQKIYDDLEARAVSAASIINIAESVYFRPDPKMYGETAGFFLTKTDDQTLKSLTPTNLLAYDEADTEHVGWYYKPIENGGPLWMEPYSNANVGMYMTSYVVPVYLGNDFLGIVGMDLDMTLLHQTIDQQSYADSVGALISQNGNLLYHRDYPGGVLKEEFTGELLQESAYFAEEYAGTGIAYQYISDGSAYRVIVSRLGNGMLFAVSVPESALFSLRNGMLIQLILIFIAALAIVLAISIRLTGRIVSPIRELTEASARIAKGELGQEIEYHSDDEIGSLADSIRKITVELKEYIDYIHGQAYLDVMTGVRNKAAYLEEEARLERLIFEKMASFTIYVFDVNGLKRMNDSKGHEYGDMLLKDAALSLRAVFGSNQVYRIGGDEFVALAKETAPDEIERQFARFTEHLRIFNIENDKYDEELSISMGAATYEPETDTEFASVFARADEAMYRCKEEYYQTHGDRRRRS